MTFLGVQSKGVYFNNNNNHHHHNKRVGTCYFTMKLDIKLLDETVQLKLNCIFLSQFLFFYKRSIKIIINF